ncbi:hypothetical protein [Candidatus Laterigemmans baculatus]|uniref:hypothetical protein n=1 Tax=Candidatus Laterigemmans baculatus TaxID=2770505 RepID=UPI0013DA3D18|nr:hypothetical protein [Candidatus Laterigemmans baculatus]
MTIITRPGVGAVLTILYTLLAIAAIVASRASAAEPPPLSDSFATGATADAETSPRTSVEP